MSEHGFGNPEVVEEEVDILIIGGGMAACGAAVEITRWAGDDVNIKCRQGSCGPFRCCCTGSVSY